MNAHGVETDMHLSRLATWLVNTVGKALALSMLVSFLVGIVAVAGHEPGVMWLAAIAGPLTFALVLYWSSAPLPYSDDELGLSADR